VFTHSFESAKSFALYVISMGLPHNDIVIARCSLSYLYGGDFVEPYQFVFEDEVLSLVPVLEDQIQKLMIEPI